MQFFKVLPLCVISISVTKDPPHDVKLNAQVVQHHSDRQLIGVIADDIDQLLHRFGRGPVKLTALPDGLVGRQVIGWTDKQTAILNRQLFDRPWFLVGRKFSTGDCKRITKRWALQFTSQLGVNLEKPESAEQPIRAAERGEFLWLNRRHGRVITSQPIRLIATTVS